jgi:hypothetical protein
VSFVLADENQAFKPVIVTCRSKVRLAANIDSIIPYLLTADGLGLLPSLSRIWDLIPFSWLVDSFFNVGDALGYIDFSYKNQLFDIIYSTHSVSVQYMFDGDDRSDFHFRDVDTGVESGYVLYLRYVLEKRVQDVIPTSLPLLTPTETSWDILGSVAVQLLPD